MNSISLLSMDLGGVLLNVLAIIGIIIAGGFLIFFLGDLLLSILDPKNNSLSDKEKQQNYEQYREPQRLQEPVRPQELTYMPTPSVHQQPQHAPEPVVAQQTYQEVDLAKALEEERRLFASEQREQVIEPLNEIKEDTTPLDIFEALKKEEEAYKAEKINSTVTPAPIAKEEPVEEDDFNFDDLFFTDNEKEEILEEPAKEEAKEPEFEFDFDFDFDAEKQEGVEQELEEELVEEPAEEEILEEELVEESVEEDDEDLKLLQEENDKLRKEIEQLVALQAQRKQELEAERQTIQTLKTTTVYESAPLLTKEEYESRLEELNARLKYNEKELRAIKREYIPLRKVRTTLERDKKKLRRKEALVAKQKILLYGVNNMADIDPEKAKKLEEDLDLLDGLRLSVQHCEEVIRNSEERYPILETSYTILTKTIEQIKTDIERVEASLAKLNK